MQMEQAQQLLEYLRGNEDSSKEEEVFSSQQQQRLEEWNDGMEDILFGPVHVQLQSLPSSLNQEDYQMLLQVSKEMHCYLIHVLFFFLASSSPRSSWDNTIVHAENEDEGTNEYLEATTTATTTDKQRIHQIVDMLSKSKHNIFASEKQKASYSSLLLHVIRAVRNWLRFNLQIQHCLVSLTTTATVVAVFQQDEMLSVYLRLVETCHPAQPNMARHAAQCLFFATYHNNNNEQQQQQQQFFLLNDLDLPCRILRLYVQTDALGLVLALTQNIHNLLVPSLGSRGAAVRAIQKAQITTTAALDEKTGLAATRMCPWIPPSCAVDCENATISFRSVWDQMLECCLCNNNNNNNNEEEPAGASSSPFPGDKDNDHRAQLVQEILRCLFALRMGANLTPTELCLIPRILNLPTTTTTTRDNGEQNDDDDDRIAECQRSVMTLLTEADVLSVGNVLVNGNDDCMDSLLRILERQIDAVVTTSRVDEAAAAALTPVLVTFYRFCQGHAQFLVTTRRAVFPNDTTTATTPTTTTTTTRSNNNMAPQDAPQGTLRWKLVRLLTWPQSHIKRFAAELLWLLCNSNPQEFSRRVGMGNALPFLAAKGHAQLPSNVFQ